MNDFTIRLRIRLPKIGRLGYAASAAALDLPGLPKALEIRPHSSDGSINLASDLVFETSGLPSEEEALKIGAEVAGDIRRALVRIGTAADFGELAPGGRFFPEAAGLRGLNDSLGLMVFPTHPRPRLWSASSEVAGSRSSDAFEKSMRAARACTRLLSNRELLAHELYTASCFQAESRSRFLLRVMAIEVLFERSERDQRARDLLDGFVATVQADEGLSKSDQRSLSSAIGMLKTESTLGAGRQFVDDRLPGRSYMNLQAGDFFVHCYGLRGKIVHSGVDRSRISEAEGPLDTLVRDLLTYDLPIPS